MIKPKEFSHLFTSESVADGHPDKICDQISDAIVDAILEQDKTARIAIEALVKSKLVVLAGEIKTESKTAPDYADIARCVIEKIGYTDPDFGFDAKSCKIILAIDEQSPDIDIGITKGQGLYKEQGAGDQGLMFGYAINETPELMPATISYSHKLLKLLREKRLGKDGQFLRPDAKSQVTAEYKNGKLCRIDSIVLSTQHSPDVDRSLICEFVIEEIIKKVIPEDLIDDRTKYHINPTGRFVIGGPKGDTGLTGRKIIVDTYGGHGGHGGGAFSGKDPSKVDRSAAYMARYIAKNIVASGLADEALVQLAYAIGYPEPVSVYVDTKKTGKVSDFELAKAVQNIFSLSPAGIIESLDLLRPIYEPTATYGHFGRDEFSWERIDKINDLLSALK